MTTSLSVYRRLILGVSVMAIAILLMAGTASAQLPKDVNDVAGKAELSITDLETGLKNIINAVLGLVSAVAVMALIYGGIKYITSLGNEDDAAKAKRVILYAIIGLIVIALSAVIVNFTLGAVKGQGDGGGQQNNQRQPVFQ